MTATLTIKDEAINGDTLNEFTLDFLTETITVQELIRSRVYQEVQDYNVAQAKVAQGLEQEVFKGLIQPSGTETSAAGFKLKQAREIDWKEQFEKALDAFQHNQILIIVDKTQVESLEEEVTLRQDSTASFLKLTPLVGG